MFEENMDKFVDELSSQKFTKSEDLKLIGIKELDDTYLEALDIIKNFNSFLNGFEKNINSALAREAHTVTKVNKLDELPKRIRASIIKDTSFIIGLNALFALGFSIVTTLNIELLLYYLPVEILILNGNGILRELRNSDFKDRKSIRSTNDIAHFNSESEREKLNDAYNQQIDKLIKLRQRLIDYKDLSNYLSNENEKILNDMINELSNFIEEKKLEKRKSLYDYHLLMEY